MVVAVPSHFGQVQPDGSLGALRIAGVAFEALTRSPLFRASRNGGLKRREISREGNNFRLSSAWVEDELPRSFIERESRMSLDSRTDNRDSTWRSALSLTGLPWMRLLPRPKREVMRINLTLLLRVLAIAIAIIYLG